VSCLLHLRAFLGASRISLDHAFLSENFYLKIVNATDLGGLWALEWAWHIRAALKATESKSEIRILFDIIRDIRVHTYDFLKFVGGL